MDDFDKLIKQCDLLITHGGVGSIIAGLKNNKKVIFSAKDQEFYIVNWLKENFIRKDDKILILGRVETALCLLVTLLEFLFFFNLYKSGNMLKYGMQYFITSAICLAYWLVYIISGIILQKVENDED